ncbi:MAG: ribulose-phosphate 3-epimerase [Spirochaetaceae bacterium]|nr:ribulose-phosphate 3-epimerase [Spirochaetaceae bacterium]
MNVKLSPSLMCANIEGLSNTLKIFEQNNVEYLHIDVMDGVFVPNLQFGTDYIKQLRRLSHIPLDIHLMIERPEDKLDWFDFHEGEYVSVHVESTRHLQRTLQRIKDKGAKPMAALNPATPLSALDWVWGDIDGVLIMTVNPGYSGQTLVPQTLQKIAECKARAIAADRADIETEVDGNVSPENAVKMAAAGANIYVLGSSCLFRKELTIDDALRTFRQTLRSL